MAPKHTSNLFLDGYYASGHGTRAVLDSIEAEKLRHESALRRLLDRIGERRGR